MFTGSWWFEVNRGLSLSSLPPPPPPLPTTPTFWSSSRSWSCSRSRSRSRFPAIAKRGRLRAAAAALATTPLHPHHQGVDEARETDEQRAVQRAVWDSLARVISVAYKAAHFLAPSAPVLFELAINDPKRPKPTRP
ncbi:hypothetical protein F5Y07DRAFT_401707 [Xylaria sp. FL0933]|nr:hypothetical protein F5Y07DRAFT_401707 [Xylaria sp. FL0933]